MDETPKPSSAKPSGISRREFARRAALASAVAAVAPAAAIATPAPPSKQPANVAAVDFGGSLSDTTSNAPQQPADLPKLSPEGHAEVEARIQSIFSQYASRFSEAQKADLRRLCNLAQPPLDRLRAYALANSDGCCAMTNSPTTGEWSTAPHAWVNSAVGLSS